MSKTAKPRMTAEDALILQAEQQLAAAAGTLSRLAAARMKSRSTIHKGNVMRTSREEILDQSCGYAFAQIFDCHSRIKPLAVAIRRR